MVEPTGTYSNYGARRARLGVLVAEAQRLIARGQPAEAVAIQRQAADEARELLARIPDDLLVRQGLASVLYNLASMRMSAGEPAEAGRELDESHDLYASLVGAVEDAELLAADVRARRGLTHALAGRAASAMVDADAAVLTYLVATEGQPSHPGGRDLARVLAMNAAVLARYGDPDLAVASADAALEFYGYPGDQAPGAAISAEDGAYLHSAATVSALFHLADGRIAEGFVPAMIIVSNLPPGDGRESLERHLYLIDGLLADNRPVPYVLDTGLVLAESLIQEVRGRGLLWVPEAEPPHPFEAPGSSWPGPAGLPLTLAEALERHAAESGDAALVAELINSQPAELVWTSSMRWMPRLELASVLRLARLAMEVLPYVYPDGLRLALESHVLLATAQRPRRAFPSPSPDDYVPTWRQLLRTSATACRSAGDDVLADDLTDLSTTVG